MKLPGVNASIPEGAEYGLQAGGWGHPPVDEHGNPRFGDWAKEQATRARKNMTEDTLWGQPVDAEEDETMYLEEQVG